MSGHLYQTPYVAYATRYRRQSGNQATRQPGLQATSASSNFQLPPLHLQSIVLVVSLSVAPLWLSYLHIWSFWLLQLMPMEPADQSIDRNGVRIAQLAEATFEAKWEILRPFIRILYIDRNFKASQVAETLRVEYNFNAQ